MDEKPENMVVIRTVASISVGSRHRKELGDIDALAASIDREGLLQPLTVTPEGTLVCGARRLAAIKILGWTELRVWVRSGISTDLEFMLAEQDDNAFHKPLTALEAAELYREMKALLAEDAAQRRAATQFSPENQPRWNGPAESAEPHTTPTGDARRQAAEMVTGTSSYTRLEEISYLQRLAEDPHQPDDMRTAVHSFLDEIRDGAATHPRWQRAKELVDAARADRDLLLQRLAEEKLAEIQRGARPKKRTARPVESAPMTARAFVLTWTELHQLAEHTDPDEIAAKLSSAEAEMFFAALDRWTAFATRLRTALGQDDAASEPTRLHAV